MAIERMIIPVGNKFNPGRPDHVARLLAAINRDTYGDGWRISHYDQPQGLVHVERQSAITSIAHGSNDSTRTVSLGRDYGPRDGAKAAARLEQNPGNAGLSMIDYDPYAGQATLAKLTTPERRCRGAVANALGVEPWEVKVQARHDGGFHVELPAKYMPSKHDKALAEVATQIIGRPGWYWNIDPTALQGEVIPAQLPTFPPTIPYPVAQAATTNTQERLLFGQSLGAHGDDAGKRLWLAFDEGPHTMLQGTPGSGKTVAINALIAGALAAGMELAIVDTPDKSVDFRWCRDFVRPGGWGGESLEEALAVLDGVYREGKRRARVLKQYDVQKTAELPAHERDKMPTMFVVADELSGMLRKTVIPKSLRGDHPMRVAAERSMMVRDLTLGTLLRILAELRFVAIRVLSSTQLATTNTGIPTELRDNSSNKILMGAANDRVRHLALNAPDTAPPFPEHLTGAAARGTGIAELPGTGSFIFKGMFATTQDYRRALLDLGRPTIPLSLARPSPTDIAIAVGEQETDQDFSGPPLAHDPDTHRNGLSGAAAAAAASQRHAQAASDHPASP